MRELENLLEHPTSADVAYRILFVLSRLAEDVGAQVSEGCTRMDVPLTHEDLASMIGSTRETVTATLSRLVREGGMRTGHREIGIHQEAARSALERR